jgi:hypothetical protein
MPPLDSWANVEEVRGASEAPTEEGRSGETPAQRVIRLEAELAEARAGLEVDNGPSYALAGARVASGSSSTNSSPFEEGRSATRRWSNQEMHALLPTAPSFTGGRLDEVHLTQICEAYTGVTGDRVLTPKKRGLVAACYRVHGEDFIPYVRAQFAATGSTNLLGVLRTSPARKHAPPAPTSPNADESSSPGADGGSSEGGVLPSSGRELGDLASLMDDSSETQAWTDAIDDPSIRWRVEAMQSQIPERGAIPVLRARPSTPVSRDPDICISCGDLLFDDRPRCRTCTNATILALDGVR